MTKKLIDQRTSATFPDLDGIPVELEISGWGLISYNGTEWHAVPIVDEWEESFFGIGGHWFTAATIRRMGWAIERHVDSTRPPYRHN
jgi:hypothetical protein